ncbi:DUF2927 domain-containing protein [Pseudoruegeria sp. SK021]|uniref:DUF2927 domain-containing protein n=1 Tax=Pseudoruegeria sp. SK021 TaxID=1933035 RepID=UPI000A260B59|nr:DUF2927 domain-containing protein [Pseudoruegeria sp. SK021]OSP54974.1 hypothetical protein BV911_10010 [Pseudoruegeria sp. SK021]
MRPGAALFRRVTGAAVMAGLAACTTPSIAPPAAPVPVAPPEAIPRPAPQASDESKALTARYSGLESDLLSRGLLRTDGGGIDTPFDARILAKNFIQVALYDEYVPGSSGLIARETASRLRRWQDPVRLSMEFGSTVPDTQKRKDMADVQALVRDLVSASDHPISVSDDQPNFVVLVINEDERQAIAPRLRALIPGISADVIQTVTTMPPTTFCMVIAFSSDDSPYIYRRAVSIVRAEHPSKLRASCFHEEITQGMGLANDSPVARPSIFNDDEEFALLTKQDRLMLTILYDPRLSPGMTRAQAEPIVKQIANELLPPQTLSSFHEARES